MAPTNQSVGRAEDGMTDNQLRKALAEFVRLGNALDAEAKRRYGPSALLFHAADGGVVFMAGDGDARYSTEQDQQSYMTEMATVLARWGRAHLDAAGAMQLI